MRDDQLLTQRLVRVHRLAFRYLLRPCPAGDGGFEGVTAGPDLRCEAESRVSGERCPKDAVVMLLVEKNDAGMVYLCGSHFGVHRRGTWEIILPDRRR